MSIVNGKIIGSCYNKERGFTHLLTIETENFVTSFGGWRLEGEGCYRWINEIMNVLELYTMYDKDIIGKVIRVEFKDGHICAIGHPVKDKWLRPEELFY